MPSTNEAFGDRFVLDTLVNIAIDDYYLSINGSLFSLAGMPQYHVRIPSKFHGDFLNVAKETISRTSELQTTPQKNPKLECAQIGYDLLVGGTYLIEYD